MSKKLLSAGILLLAIITLIGEPRVCAQDLEAKVNEIVVPLVNGNKNLGMVIGVYDIGSEYPRMFYYGRTNKEERVTPNEYTVFEIGSITNTFTTTMLAMMERDGLIKINDPVQNYLPAGLTIHNHSSNEITRILHLATHTAGFPRMPNNLIGASKTNVKNPFKNYNEEDLTNFVNNFISDRAPGHMYEYSNVGMGFLGYIMTKTSNMTYQGLLNKYLLDSLGMPNTGVVMTEDMKKMLAKGYDANGEPSGSWDFDVLTGAGGMRSNLKDMMTYLAFQMGKTDKLNFKEGLFLTQKRRAETGLDNIWIGLGWHISETSGGKQVIWHDGSTGGYRAMIAFMPELQTGIVVLSNQANNIDGVAMEILKYTNR